MAQTIAQGHRGVDAGERHFALAAGDSGIVNNYGTLVRRTVATGVNNINVDFYNRGGVVEIDGPGRSFAQWFDEQDLPGPSSRRRDAGLRRRR